MLRSTSALKTLCNEDFLRDTLSPKIYERGETYYQDGMVSFVAQRGEIIVAEVEGSESQPYSVVIKSENMSGLCSCAYMEQWSAWCKHIVAVLVRVREEPESVEMQKPVAELLQSLDRQQLQTVINELLEQRPALYEIVESQVEAFKPKKPRRKK